MYLKEADMAEKDITEKTLEGYNDDVRMVG